MRTRICRSIAVAPLAAALVLLPPTDAGQGLHAQAPAGGLIKVDIRALTADGQPVTDLKASDVSLRVGGKPRELRSLDLIGSGPAAKGPVPANPPYATNAGGGATRTVLLVMDDESVNPGREQSLKSALGRIAEKLPAGDRVGLISVRRGGINIPPSTDRTTLRATIDGLRGQSSSQTSEDFRCRTQVTLQALESILQTAPAHSPTSIVFMSASLSQPSDSIARMTTTNSSRASDLCRLTTVDFERVGAAAAGSRAQLFVVQVIDGTTMAMSEAAPGIENIAGVTGVETLRLSATGETIADRILRELAASYTASFVADPGDRTALPQPLEVKVTRPGITALAPSRIAVPKADAKAGKLSAKDMAHSPTVFTDLPIRAAGFASRGPDKKLKVIALFEPLDPALKLSAATVALFDTKGKLTAQWTAQEADFSRSPVTAALTVVPGTYRMRVAAIDSTGRSGTADYSLEAEMTIAEPLMLSTLVVGAPKAGSFAPQLHFGPSDAAAAGYLEIYEVPKGGTVTVSLELAPSEDAPAIGSTPAQVVAGETEDMRRAVGGFSITGLEPGDHVLRALVSLDGKVVGRAVRTIRKAGS
jgi:hypothetical protein